MFPNSIALTFLRLRHSEEEGEHGDEEEVNVQELEVRQVGVDGVEDEDGSELGQGVGGHVLEDAEGSHQGATAWKYKRWKD